MNWQKSMTLVDNLHHIVDNTEERFAFFMVYSPKNEESGHEGKGIRRGTPPQGHRTLWAGLENFRDLFSTGLLKELVL